MADRGHADRDQVLSRQVRQDISVDFVITERRLVLFKTKLLKPTRDIDCHDGCPHGETHRLPIELRQQQGRFNLPRIAAKNPRPLPVEVIRAPD